MDKSSFYGVKNRAGTNLKKVNLHLSHNLHLTHNISLRKRYTYKTGIYILSRSYSKAKTSKLEMPKIVSIETLKKQKNDFITRVVLANLMFVFIIQSRD
jgi:hypothetical protein